MRKHEISLTRNEPFQLPPVWLWLFNIKCFDWRSMKEPTLKKPFRLLPVWLRVFNIKCYYYNEKLNSKKWPQNLDLRPCYRVLAIFPTVHWVWANSGPCGPILMFLVPNITFLGMPCWFRHFSRTSDATTGFKLDCEPPNHPWLGRSIFYLLLILDLETNIRNVGNFHLLGTLKWPIYSAYILLQPLSLQNNLMSPRVCPLITRSASWLPVQPVANPVAKRRTPNFSISRKKGQVYYVSNTCSRRKRITWRNRWWWNIILVWG